MSFDWKEFQDVGDNLKKTPREAYQRSAVGRYYYSCYVPVKEYFETVIRAVSPDEIHIKLSLKICVNLMMIKRKS